MRPPSTASVAAFLRPTSIRCPCQIRASSTGRNLTGLDKLHRRQKEGIRQELLASTQRARTDPSLNFTPPKAAPLAPASAEDPTSASSTAAVKTPQTLPYTIERTRRGHQLPVYSLTKAGGSKRLTRLRKVSGDLHALKTDLTKALGLDGGFTNKRGEKVDGVSINWLNKHIIVRGWRGAEIRAWAVSSGF